MVYTDRTHLVADSMFELHTFAARIGLKRHRFHNRRGSHHPHYDLLKKGEVGMAVSLGAKVVSRREVLRLAKLLAAK